MQKERSELLTTPFDEFRDSEGKLLFLGCESISVKAGGLRFSTRRVLLIRFFFFFTYFVLLKN